ncbi:MAG: DUF6702 family protein [Nonlabens sp.]
MKGILFFFQLIVLFPLVNHSAGARVDCKFDGELRFRESVNTAKHKYYVSVSNATYSDKAGAVQLITRFFIDDLENVLNERYESDLVLGEPAQIKEIYPQLKEYMNLTLQATIDGKKVAPDFLGAEYEGDQIVLYTELPVNERPEKITMAFSAFMELFPEQKNLLHFQINNQRKTIIIDGSHSEGTVIF